MFDPQLIKGNVFTDHRGSVLYNNHFDATPVKRIYLIENESTEFVRAWQGHKIEQKWMVSVSGRFLISLVRINDWENPDPTTEVTEFIACSNQLNVIHIPAGFANSIQALDDHSRLLVMADHLLGEVEDEYRFDPGYFINRTTPL
ncbi:WxcM-like domain-containing protein [Chryseobacterium sp.]|uniref:WxcM-like domain-containing protein n=1 Tax=Chryseobacterium sp. TaxID=1871047 RepID=UPI0011C9ADD0|nr:WxcM-like domain-containing protein [Chryseobacterium sp.]TXF77562.1 sugar epimerase [Chryseobacterium sp.]